MKLPPRGTVLCMCLAALTAASADRVLAQEPTQQYDQAISANPFGLLLEWFNAEYERVIGETVTTGLGGSYISGSDDRYVNGDVFLRYYPQGQPLQGWAFGAKAGLTSVRGLLDGTSETDTYFGFGFDVNHSWLLGANDNFYVGVGLGLKRLFGLGDRDVDLAFFPTVRLVNIGFAF